MHGSICLRPAKSAPLAPAARSPKGALLVDVRERAEAARTTFDVPAPVQMPLSEFEQRFDELPRDRPLVLACESGPPSLKATCFLTYQGFTDVANTPVEAAKQLPQLPAAAACPSGATLASRK